MVLHELENASSRSELCLVQEYAPCGLAVCQPAGSIFEAAFSLIVMAT
jgi:hypothetical protein